MGDTYPKKVKCKEYGGTLEILPGSGKDGGDGSQGWCAGMAPVEERRDWVVGMGMRYWERCH